jgi:hypothetical protein
MNLKLPLVANKADEELVKLATFSVQSLKLQLNRAYVLVQFNSN